MIIFSKLIALIINSKVKKKKMFTEFGYLLFFSCFIFFSILCFFGIPKSGSHKIFKKKHLGYFTEKQKTPFIYNVMVGMMTYPKNHDLAIIMKKTWGKYFQNFFVYTEKPEIELSPFVILKNPYFNKSIVTEHPQGKCVWKSFLLFEDLFKKNPNSDWYMKSDDDTFINTVELKKFLRKFPYPKINQYIIGRIWDGERTLRPIFVEDQIKLKKKYLTVKDKFLTQWPGKILFKNT